MKILHIVAGNLNGGAARGAYWLHCGLIELGVDSKVFTNSLITLGDENVISTTQSKKSKVINMIRLQVDNVFTLFYKNRMRMIFSTGIHGIDFTKTRAYLEADIVHLHWINAGFTNIKHLAKITKPIVWTMRDMWPMTGGCHVAESFPCDKYKTGCGNCVQLNSKSSYDLSSFILNRKKKYFPKNMKIIGISNWLSEKARESELFKDFDIQTISNNISIKEFFPIDKGVARQVMGINTNKKVILCGSISLNDPWKGFGKFQEAVKNLDKDKYFLCFFGNVDRNAAEGLGFQYKGFGYLNDNIALRLAYSSADIFVAPSLMDAFGKTLAEAMACGTPVVCFDATGPRDIVDHKITGYKARPFESEDLAAGINWILQHSNLNQLVLAAREKVIREFDSNVIAQKYIKLYEESIDRKNAELSK